MPQIFMIVGPSAKDILTAEKIPLIVPKLIRTVEKVFGLEGLNDVVFTAIGPAIYTKGEADVQIEIRYTAGEDEYHRGEPFDPSTEKQEGLVHLIENVFQRFIMDQRLTALSLSVWCKPYYKTVFKMFQAK